jgi:WD40 repeat protein/serine/threonine protein kinase
MSGSRSAGTASGAVDQQLAEVVAEMTDRLHAGEPVDVEQYIARHPELADRLRPLVAALDLLARFSSSAGSKRVLGRFGAGEGTSGTLGDFRILREVGRGGMGIVYEAEQVSLGRRVALKVLPFSATMDPRQLQRFLNEARAAAGLHHTNIVPVFAVGSERGVHYYAMQFIEARTLADLIDQRRGGVVSQGPMGSGPAAAPATTARVAAAATSAAPPDAAYFRRAAEWGIQAAEALDCAHALGVVHRDVKPGNLLVDTAGRLWVTDFGLAQIRTDVRLTASGDLVGTLRYMSPEQALARRLVIDHRTDVYSLGATLYELLTLRPVFEGGDRQELLRQIAFEEPKALRRIDKAIPAELETIVLKAIEKDPADRYTTAQELADDLRRQLADRPIRARRPSLLHRAAKWLRRHRGLVGAAVAFLVLAVGVLGVSLAVIAGERAEALRQRDAARKQETRAVELAAIARARLYVADIGLAHDAWQNNDLQRARELLAHHIPEPGEEDVRGFEWYYLARLAQGMDLRNRGGAVLHVAFSPGGRLLASAGQDGLVRLWDMTTRQLEGVCRGHQGEVNWACFSPDGRRLASAGDDGTVRLWDVAARTQVRLFGTAGSRTHDGEAVAVVFSADGRTLASGGDDKIIKLWDVATGRRLQELRGHTGRIDCLALSPDGKTLASACPDGTVWLWDLVTRQAVTLVQDGEAAAVAFAPHRPLLAVACRGPTNAVAIWDLTQFRKTATLASHGAAESVIFLDDSRVAAGHELGEVVVWALPRRQEERSWVAHSRRIWSVAFSAERGLLASAGAEGLIDLRAWPPPVPGETLERGHPATITALSYSPDGKMLAVGRSDGRVLLSDAGRGASQAEFRAGGPVYALAFDPQGALLGAGTVDGYTHVWDLAGRRLLVELGDDKWGIPAVDLRDGCRLAFNGADGAMQFWDLAPGQAPRRLSHRIPNAYVAAFSPNGRLLATGEAGHIRLWEAAAVEPRAVLKTAGGVATRMAFSPDGQWLVGVSVDDGELRSWDTATGQSRLVYSEGGRAVAAIAVSPDGKTLASAGNGDRVRLWSTVTGQELFALRVPSAQAISALAFAPDGRTLVAGIECRDGKGNEVMAWHTGPAAGWK